MVVFTASATGTASKRTSGGLRCRGRLRRLHQGARGSCAGRALAVKVRRRKKQFSARGQCAALCATDYYSIGSTETRSRPEANGHCNGTASGSGRRRDAAAPRHCGASGAVTLGGQGLQVPLHYCLPSLYKAVKDAVKRLNEAARSQEVRAALSSAPVLMTAPAHFYFFFFFNMTAFHPQEASDRLPSAPPKLLAEYMRRVG